jgi:YHS domain-containing protein
MNTLAVTLTCLLSTSQADPAKLAAQKDALKPLGSLIAKWKGTGTVDSGSSTPPTRFWTQHTEWEWKFKGDDAWLAAKVEKGDYFTALELRYHADTKQFQWTQTTPDKETHTFLGTLSTKDKQQILTVERTDLKAGVTQRVTVTLLHDNRYLHRLEEQPDGMKTFRRKYQIGETKEGVPFANVPQGPECIVSGGKGTIRVSHKGVDYYVCCSGCRDAFKDEPEKFIKEFEAKKKKEADQKEKK